MSTFFYVVSLLTFLVRGYCLGSHHPDLYEPHTYPPAIDSYLTIRLGIQEGLGLHINDVKNGRTKPEILMKNALILYVAELFYATALFCAKASILSFYWRMFRVTNIKLPIQILGCCSLIWIIIRVSILLSMD